MKYIYGDSVVGNKCMKMIQFAKLNLTSYNQVAEKKIMDIEEELKIVGANMQTLEMSEEKTMKREEGLQEEILELR